ncbi:hypothetical protein [Peptostreptococcus faecalis]|uniref:hypothetical protein n=1 Tax=Peptostreptococcus faecalis TaxID=2045015 RepID=UPI000C7CAA84|nr:hypothetical protein [Peptostreptococcus faecalis]
MKKFITSETVFVELNKENPNALKNIIEELHMIGEENNTLTETQVSAVLKPISETEFSLCYSVTALYYKES